MPRRLGAVMSPPEDGEIARLDAELTDIWSRLKVLAAEAGVTLPGDRVEKFSRHHAIDAHIAMEQRVQHQRRWVAAVRKRLAPDAPAAVDAGDAEFPEITGSLRHRFAPYVGVVGLLLLILGFVVVVLDDDPEVRRALAVELCARPPPCAGDSTSIGVGRTLKRRIADTVVLFRRSEDCAREVEVYYDLTGRYLFRGSLDEPDPSRRDDFYRSRRGWFSRHTLARVLPCERADEL